MDVYTALRKRRSITALREEAPPRELVQRILDAAVWAPNHHLTEPWRFHVLSGAARDALGAAVAAWLEGVVDGDSPAAQAQIKAARTRLLRAPVVIVVSHTRSDDPVTDLEDYAACCCATQNLLLAAHAEDLATKWRTGDMCNYRATKEYLGLTDADRIVAFVYLGYPASGVAPDSRRRRPPVINWLGWNG